MNFIIRKAVKADAPAILGLVKELATYEKEPDAVEVTLSEFEKDGFGRKPVYSAFVAETDGKIIGMALYYIKYSTWKGKAIYLDDIIVNGKYRRHGMGGRLFEEVVRAGRQMGVRKIDWQVLDWNEPAIQFYKKYSAVFNKEWVNCTIYEKEIKSIVLTPGPLSIK